MQKRTNYYRLDGSLAVRALIKDGHFCFWLWSCAYWGTEICLIKRGKIIKASVRSLQISRE